MRNEERANELFANVYLLKTFKTLDTISVGAKIVERPDFLF